MLVEWDNFSGFFSPSLFITLIGVGGQAESTIGHSHDHECSHFRPKPILIEKQSSEPNSPIAQTFASIREQETPLSHANQPTQTEPYHDQSHIVHRRPPMNRGYSDLSNRIKKRVTLR